MIQLIDVNGKQTYGLKSYAVDSVQDISNLPVTDLMGSTAIVISTSDVYMLNGEGEWTKL